MYVYLHVARKIKIKRIEINLHVGHTKSMFMLTLYSTQAPLDIFEMYLLKHYENGTFASQEQMFHFP